jgi:hypothetical protein
VSFKLSSIYADAIRDSILLPSLNITQRLNDYFTLKGGVAKAYKAPNMYQNAEGYKLSLHLRYLFGTGYQALCLPKFLVLNHHYLATSLEQLMVQVPMQIQEL